MLSWPTQLFESVHRPEAMSSWATWLPHPGHPSSFSPPTLLYPLFLRGLFLLVPSSDVSIQIVAASSFSLVSLPCPYIIPTPHHSSHSFYPLSPSSSFIQRELTYSFNFVCMSPFRLFIVPYHVSNVYLFLCGSFYNFDSACEKFSFHLSTLT